ncbi:MAG: ornithine cyclodeaminase, partial [Rubrivivax sp.]|nr:ornithine cyclodeaminase [Rubrivivax sp.]
MTTLLTTHDITRIVAAHGLPQVLRRLEEAITTDFRRWADFHKVARVASHSKAGVIELMPVADAQQYSFKYVNGHPGNGLQGLPTVMAFGVLADVATGLPTLLSELTITTAMRTAATSVMAARLLARPASRTMALIGNGAQSEFQALAFHHLLGVKRLQLFDTDRSATAKLMRHLQSVPGLEVQVCANTADALRGADIVTTVTADKCNAVIVSADMLAPGMHLNAVGGDCPGKTELEAAVLRAAQVFVEYEPQTRVEGELQQMPADFEVTELWRVLHGQATGRRDDAAITLFDSVGFALEDFSALRLMAELAQGLGLGRPLDLIPELSDPRDLFSLL